MSEFWISDILYELPPTTASETQALKTVYQVDGGYRLVITNAVGTEARNRRKQAC